MFIINFFMLIFLSLMFFFTDLVIWWMILEVFFYCLIFLLLFKVKSLDNLIGVIIYFFLQGVVSLIFILFLFLFISNYMSSNGSFYIFGVVNSLYFIMIIKMGLFPFYFQVVFIFLKLNNEQCFVMGFYPKVLPIIWMMMLNDNNNNLFIYTFLVLSFLISAYNSMMTTDFRELMGWSSINLGGWIIMSLSLSEILTLMLLGQYYFGLFLFFYFTMSYSTNFFLLPTSHFNNTMSIMWFLTLLMMTGLAPVGLFLFKLFLINYFNLYFLSIYVFFILLCLFSSFFFYLRMLQYALNLGGSFSTFNFNMITSKSNFLMLFLMLMINMVVGISIFIL